VASIQEAHSAEKERLRMKLALAPLCAALALGSAGCASAGPDEPPSTQAILDWRGIATDADRTRLRQWRTAWVRGLAKAEASGHKAALVGEGRLLEPDAALAWQDPPAGSYRCRTLKIGAQSAGMLDFVAYPPFECRIRREDGLMSFAKLNGSQRPIGLILPYGANRMVFLGTLQLGDETRPLQYGRDRERDLAGLAERIGENRWRLVFPYPHFESIIDILELVPATPAPRG
jgi:hypothetical protein